MIWSHAKPTRAHYTVSKHMEVYILTLILALVALFLLLALHILALCICIDTFDAMVHDNTFQNQIYVRRKMGPVGSVTFLQGIEYTVHTRVQCQIDYWAT